MLFLTFGGEYKGGEEPEHGEHAAYHRTAARVALADAVPLVILAVLAAVAGFVEHQRRVRRAGRGLAAARRPRSW